MAALTFENPLPRSIRPQSGKCSDICLASRSSASARLRSVTSLLVSIVATGRPRLSCCKDHLLATVTRVPSRFAWTSLLPNGRCGTALP